MTILVGVVICCCQGSKELGLRLYTIMLSSINVYHPVVDWEFQGRERVGGDMCMCSHFEAVILILKVHGSTET